MGRSRPSGLDLAPLYLDDGRILVSREVFAYLAHRNVVWLRQKLGDPDRPDDYCDVACDVATRAVLLDRDQAEEVNRKYPYRTPRAQWTPLD